MEVMNLGKVKEILFEQMSQFPALKDFKLVKSYFGFKRKTPGIEVSIDFTNNYWIDEIHLMPYVHIKFKEIHKICDQCGDNLNYTAYMNLFILEAVKKRVYNVHTSWKYQCDGKDRFFLFSLNDTYKILPKLEELVNLAVEYANSLSDINAIDRLYNTEPYNEYNPSSNWYGCHCVVGLIAAKLAHNPNYKELERLYTKRMREMDLYKKDKDSYEKIRNYLENMQE